MVGAKAREIYDRQAKDRQRKAGGNRTGTALPETLPEALKGDARDIAGKAVGVSGRTVGKAQQVIDHGVPELARAVDEGRMSVGVADKINSVTR